MRGLQGKHSPKSRGAAEIQPFQRVGQKIVEPIQQVWYNTGWTNKGARGSIKQTSTSVA